MKDKKNEETKGERVNELESSIQSKEESKFKKFRRTKIYKVITYIIAFLIGGIICSPSEVPTMTNEEIDSVVAENTSYENKLKEANTKIDQLNAKVESAKPWFEMKEDEQEKLKQEQEAKEQAEREAKEQAEKEAQAAKEAEEKKGYDTGITYSQLARTPDDYLFKKVKFSGKVLQVMEDSDTVQIRLAVNGNYDNVILCEYTSSTVSSRVLEDDYITVYGLSSGLITYTSTLGGNITIPSMAVSKIDQ